MSRRGPRQPWDNSRSSNGPRPFQSHGAIRQPYDSRQGNSSSFDEHRGSFFQGRRRQLSHNNYRGNQYHGQSGTYQAQRTSLTSHIDPEYRANLALKEEARLYLGMERSTRVEPVGGGWGSSQNIRTDVDNRCALSRERDNLQEEWRRKSAHNQSRPSNWFSHRSTSSSGPQSSAQEESTASQWDSPQESRIETRIEAVHDENQNSRQRYENEAIALNRSSLPCSGQLSLKRKLVSDSLLQAGGSPNVLKKSSVANEMMSLLPSPPVSLAQLQPAEVAEREDQMFSDLSEDVMLFDETDMEDIVLEVENSASIGKDENVVDSLVSKLTVLSVAANPEIPDFLRSGPATSLFRPAAIPRSFDMGHLAEVLRRHWVQPTRWVCSSRHLYSSCEDSDKVIMLFFRKLHSMRTFLHQKSDRLQASLQKFRTGGGPRATSRDAEEQKLAGQIQIFLQTAAIAALPPLNFYLMRPLILERDRVQEITHMRDLDHKRAKMAAHHQAKSHALEDVGNRPDQVLCAAWDGTSDCGQLFGYQANLFWRINRLNSQLTHASFPKNLRFCEEHTAAIISRDFCPICLKIEAFSASNESTERFGVYCRGPRGSENHFFHPECVSATIEMMCPHCGNTDQKEMSGCTAVGPDWSKNKNLIETSNATIRRAMTDQNLHHLAASACLDRTREARFSTDTTVAIWAPLPGPGKTYPVVNAASYRMIPNKKKVSAPPTKRTRMANKLDSAEDTLEPDELERTVQSTRTFFMPNLQSFFHETSLLALSDGLLEKYAAPLMTLSADCGGCFCREKCIPDRCPCMQWNGPKKHYTPDGRLVLGFDTKTEFIRECSEICGCCFNRCGNRVSQMPSKVSTRLRGPNLCVTQPVKLGQFICRIGGTLTEAVPESDDTLPATFFLPKFGLWPDSRRSLSVNDVNGPARHFRKVRAGKSPTVIAVLVIQTPISLQLNVPRQLAVPTVAFFAAKNLPAASILSYGEDFRTVNATGPRSLRIPQDERVWRTGGNLLRKKNPHFQRKRKRPCRLEEFSIFKNFQKNS